MIGRAALAALVGFGLAACFVTPTYTDQAMRRQAATSAQETASEVETVRLAVQTQLRGKSWWRYTDVVVTDAERLLSKVGDTFSSRQPPSRSAEKVQDRVKSAISDSSDLVEQVRIAVRDHDDQRLSKLLKQLEPISKRLSKLEQQYK